MRGKLGSALFICAMRDSEEEVIFRFTDVAAIEGSRSRDTSQWIEKALQDWFDCLDFALASGSAGTGEDRASGGEDGRILDECRVGIAKIGVENGEFKAAF
jgi:hypothetical protein